MNNSELDQKLKAARGPALPADYQEKFSKGVLSNLRSAPSRATPEKHPWRPRLPWAIATTACILAAFIAGRWHGRTEATQDILADSKLIQETLTMFPNRVRAIVRDDHGMSLVLSDKEDVPVSTPIYVRICDGNNCASLVTFSGQEIQLAGQKITVLSDASGGIILEGNQFVWSSTGHSSATARLKIEARNLSPKLM